eukprot:jgi/Chlat1/1129/Chrsp111S01604
MKNSDTLSSEPTKEDDNVRREKTANASAGAAPPGQRHQRWQALPIQPLWLPRTTTRRTSTSTLPSYNEGGCKCGPGTIKPMCTGDVRYTMASPGDDSAHLGDVRHHEGVGQEHIRHRRECGAFRPQSPLCHLERDSLDAAEHARGGDEPRGCSLGRESQDPRAHGRAHHQSDGAQDAASAAAHTSASSFSIPSFSCLLLVSPGVLCQGSSGREYWPGAGGVMCVRGGRKARPRSTPPPPNIMLVWKECGLVVVQMFCWLPPGRSHLAW